ncbi:AMP-binding protein [Bacillus horti]|uniref:Long-chain acyl-CoA synthetase n=1 Tax=Caldalkalibacillus horti TaxID=77523 RepID=A0ABT9VTR3_9BACI|nr:AMP-binding protein [Bacillus horti]MDQ0164376.1 long-chain acyl-CoA synthetase [Bacillus horti]
MPKKLGIWTEHYPDEIATSLEYPEETLPFFLEEANKVKPNHTAIRFLGKSVSYRKLYEQALSLANALRSLGVTEGKRVALMLANCPQAVIGYFGVLLAGGVVVQTNPLYMERELEHQLKDSGAEVIIALDLVYPKLARVQAETAIKDVIITGIKDFLPFPKNVLYPYVQKKQGLYVNVQYGERIHSFTELLKKHKPKRIEISSTPDDLAALQYTGGTTGLPKGVMLTHRNLVVNAYQCSQWIYKVNYGQERVLGVVPLFHVYGMTVVMNLGIMTAATMVLVPKFEAKDVLKTIQKEKPTLFPGAPTIYIGLLNESNIEKYDLSSIEACISGSAGLPVDVQKRFEQITGGKLVEGYGLTETSPVTHANLIWGNNVVGSIGLPWPDTEAIILSTEDGEELPPREIGELAIKGPQVMQGYWNNEKETEKAFKNGWFMTGDLGYMDEKGYFYIVERKKEMIVASGYNIYPREIEEVLYEHEAVKECAVIGVTHEYRGETVKAYIVKKDGYEVSEQELDQFCRQKLSVYKVPKIYEFRTELPKSIIGKILKRVLVEEGTEKQTDESINKEAELTKDNKESTVNEESAVDKSFEENEANAGREGEELFRGSEASEANEMVERELNETTVVPNENEAENRDRED